MSYANNDLDKLRVLIQTSYKWVPGPNNTFIALGYDHKHQPVEQPVPFTLLDAYHPKLLQAMQALFHWYERQEKRDHIPNKAVIATVNYLQHGGIEMMSTDYRPVTLFSIQSMHTAAWSEHILEVRGMAVHTQTGRGPYRAVTFATSEYNAYPSVHKTDLEKRYPGWEQRWKIASELGVDMPDLVTHVFSTDPRSEQTATMNTVTFQYV